jgi:hypothetical protein
MMSHPQSEKMSHATSTTERASIDRSKAVAGLVSNSKSPTFKSGSSANHLILTSDELAGLSNLVEGIKKEISAYSKIEHEYLLQLENALAKEATKELEDNRRMSHTINQIRRLRSYKKEALDELAAANMKIAQLECRMERITNQESEAELNVRLYELQMLYGGPVEDANTDHRKPQHTVMETKPVVREISKPGELVEQKEVITENRRFNHKAARTKRARKERIRKGQDSPPLNDLVNTDSTIRRHPEVGYSESQTTSVEDNDVLGNEMSDSMTSAFPPSLPTDATEQRVDSGNELSDTGNIINEDDTVTSDDIRSIMNSIQEQSQPLPMPELDIGESIAETSKKKRWSLFSLGKKKEMKQ